MSLFNKSKRTCIFCDSKNLTLEHIYPKWLFQILKLENRTFNPGNWDMSILTSHSTDTLIKNQQYGDGREVRYDEFKTRRVCGTCNNGWLSDLETKVKPIIENLYKISKYNLNPEEAYDLSLWAVVKIIIIGYAVEANYTADYLIRETVRAGIIPEGFIVEYRKLESDFLNYYVGNITPVEANKVDHEQMMLAWENFFTSALQIRTIGLRITHLRTSIPVQRTQINEELMLLYPYKGRLPFLRVDFPEEFLQEQNKRDLKDTEISGLCNSITICDKLY